MTKLTGAVFTFTVSGVTFTVSDKTYRHCPVCTYVSFITNCKSFVTDCKSYATDCKSENSACKFWQLLHSVTIARTAIQLTVTRGAVIEIDFVRPGGIRNQYFCFHSPPSPGRMKRGGGGKWKRFTSSMFCHLVDRGGAGGKGCPPRPKFLHFHAVFGKKWTNSRLPPPSGVGALPRGNPESAIVCGLFFNVFFHYLDLTPPPPPHHGNSWVYRDTNVQYSPDERKIL